MEINWVILGILSVCVIVLLVYLFRQNEKDKKDLTDILNKDYKNANEDESEPNDKNI